MSASPDQADVTERSSVRAVQRALRLLECFSESGPMLTLSQFARQAELPISTASRLLATLEAEGFARRTAGGGYLCGARLLQIGLTALQSISTYDVAEPHLHRLTEETGESSYLAIPGEERHIIYIRQSLSQKSIKHSTWLGRSLPIEGTAIGSAMIGAVGPAGFAASRHTIEPDVTAIAAPVYGPDGSIVAGINLVGPTYRISDADIERLGGAVTQAATAVSRALGARKSQD